MKLKKDLTPDQIEALLDPNHSHGIEIMDLIFREFENYLIHGGFLTAMNNMAQYGYILQATFSTYSDWIRGDVLKRNKQEHYLQEIMGAIIRRYGSRITWNALLDDLSISLTNSTPSGVSIVGMRDT